MLFVCVYDNDIILNNLFLHLTLLRSTNKRKTFFRSRYGIRSNVVVPGAILTKMVTEM